MKYQYGLAHVLLNSVISNDLEWLSKIFNDTKRCTVSLRQLSYLFVCCGGNDAKHNMFFTIDCGNGCGESRFYFSRCLKWCHFTFIHAHTFFLHRSTASLMIGLPMYSMRRCFKLLVSHHFCRSYLKANKVSKSEGTRKVAYAYYFWKCADAVYQKLSKLVRASSQNYSSPKLARFFETRCIFFFKNLVLVFKVLRLSRKPG